MNEKGENAGAAGAGAAGAGAADVNADVNAGEEGPPISCFGG